MHDQILESGLQLDSTILDFEESKKVIFKHIEANYGKVYLQYFLDKRNQRFKVTEEILLKSNGDLTDKLFIEPKTIFLLGGPGGEGLDRMKFFLNGLMNAKSYVGLLKAVERSKILSTGLNGAMTISAALCDCFLWEGKSMPRLHTNSQANELRRGMEYVFYSYPTANREKMKAKVLYDYYTKALAKVFLRELATLLKDDYYSPNFSPLEDWEYNTIQTLYLLDLKTFGKKIENVLGNNDEETPDGSILLSQQNKIKEEIQKAKANQKLSPYQSSAYLALRSEDTIEMNSENYEKVITKSRDIKTGILYVLELEELKKAIFAKIKKDYAKIKKSGTRKSMTYEQLQEDNFTLVAWNTKSEFFGGTGGIGLSRMELFLQEFKGADTIEAIADLILTWWFNENGRKGKAYGIICEVIANKIILPIKDIEGGIFLPIKDIENALPIDKYRTLSACIELRWKSKTRPLQDKNAYVDKKNREIVTLALRQLAGQLSMDYRTQLSHECNVEEYIAKEWELDTNVSRKKEYFIKNHINNQEQNSESRQHNK